MAIAAGREAWLSYGWILGRRSRKHQDVLSEPSRKKQIVRLGHPQTGNVGPVIVPKNCVIVVVRRTRSETKTRATLKRLALEAENLRQNFDATQGERRGSMTECQKLGGGLAFGF